MSHLLPPAAHPARALFDVADLAAIGTGERPIPTEINYLRRMALATLAGSSVASRVAFIRLNPSSDQVELVTFGRKGGWRREWTFGSATRQMRVV